MKVLMLFVLCLAFLSVHAQNNNLGFENWSNGLVFTPVPKESPIPGAGDCHPYLSGNAELLSSSGMIPNDQILPGWSAMQFGIMRTPDAHSGKYAVIVCMWYNGSRGVMAIGQSENVAQTIPKISLAKKLYGVSGFYKYKVDSLAPNDTYKKNTLMHIASYKTNPVSGALEEIQHDSVTFAKAGIYTEFYLPVVYADTTLIADSVSVWFESKGYNSGTTSCGLSHFLYLDDLQFHYQPYTLHILETGQNKKIEVYAKATEQATENYRIVKNKYDNALATATDLLEADVAQLQARLNYVFAKADAMVAYNKLLETSGTLSYESK